MSRERHPMRRIRSCSPPPAASHACAAECRSWWVWTLPSPARRARRATTSATPNEVSGPDLPSQRAGSDRVAMGAAHPEITVERPGRPGRNGDDPWSATLAENLDEPLLEVDVARGHSGHLGETAPGVDQ